MFLTRLKPLQNELELGYLGRIMNFNGRKCWKSTLDLAAKYLGYNSKTREHIPSLVLISKIADIDLHTFICNHTILPLRRSITNYLSHLNHGNKDTLGLLLHHGIRKARDGAYFCKNCIKEDHKLYGFSYWRRDIQIPCQFWCDIHKIPLSYTLDRNAYFSSPTKFMTTACTYDKSLISEFKKNNRILNFRKISLHLLKQRKPLHKDNVADAFFRQLYPIKKNNYLNVVYDENSLFVDIVLDLFHPKWLKMACPFFIYNHKPYSYDIDHLLNYRLKYFSANAYILAASVLFETAEEALQTLTIARK